MALISASQLLHTRALQSEMNNILGRSSPPSLFSLVNTSTASCNVGVA